MATLYTRTRGTLPVRVISLWCKGCHTTYRPNYSIRNASSPTSERVYYGDIPDVVEASEYAFVETKLAILFRTQMAFSHASGETVARIYNMGLSDIPDARPLTVDTVWNAFYLHSLLLHSVRTSQRLILPHAGSHSERFMMALEARNTFIVGEGQPLWAHACDLCEKIYSKGDADSQSMERLSAAVMDGVTVGHPRCNVDQCTNRLRSPRDRFCPAHDSRRTLCAIHQCELPVTDGRRTCSTTVHREFEEQRRQEGQAIFRLKRRRAATSKQPKRKGKKAPQKPERLKMKNALGRRYTHCQQLMFRPCGVILARATFYEAESVSNALAFINRVFPADLPRALPCFLFYDNNCQLLKHILSVGDQRLLQIGLPVDVFHAIRKHKDSDGFCIMNCNPAGFPELYSIDNEWLFNTSAAEQGNVWFGKFMPVVREMDEIHFNFFLDEMILIRNNWRVGVLEKRGLHPRIIPRAELALPRE
ncbi:hypothetical protein C8Q76DRAFT_627155 [Earliella scabrosa]|nr:hypothetical protein C8Q76DRAFT_627155 [Earliella scabrosa]